MSVSVNTQTPHSVYQRRRVRRHLPAGGCGPRAAGSQDRPRATTFWAGCICPAITIRKSSPASRQLPSRSAATPTCWWWPASRQLPGARAVVEAVKGVYHNELEEGLKIYFCGNSISPHALNDIIALCKGKRFSINVISKSGTTTETSLAFRVLRKLLEEEVGVEEANKRIYAPPTAPAAPSSSWLTARAGPPSWCRTTWAAATRCCRPWACCPSPPPASTSPS